MTLLGRWNWWGPAILRRGQPVPASAHGQLVGVWPAGSPRWQPL